MRRHAPADEHARRGHHSDHRHPGERSGRRDPRRAAAYFAEHFRFGDDTVSLWWATVNTAKVGFVRVELWNTEDERGGFIRDFYIRPDVRRQGVGSAVVRAIRAVAERDGWIRMDLNVREDNPSGLSFWQSQGFNLQLYQLRQYIARDAR